MGLAPLHTWLPDAHSEAPSIVSALLSGVLLNCAFLAILRGHSLLVKAGLGEFSQDLLVLFGLLSMAVAGLFIINQTDYKRLLAYSSIEHMGILALGVGIGGIAGFGAMLHAVNHSVAKAMLFLAAGNTLAYFRTKSTLEARGTLATAADDRNPVDRRPAGHHRLAAVRRVRQRIRRSERHDRRRTHTSWPFSISRHCRSSSSACRPSFCRSSMELPTSFSRKEHRHFGDQQSESGEPRLAG